MFRVLPLLPLVLAREARGAAVIDREARSAAVIDREARSAAVIDREARSAAVIDREARSAAVIDIGSLAALHEEVRLPPRPRPEPVPLPAAFSAPRTPDEAYRNFLSLGEAYFSGGAEPRVGGRTYILAWPHLLSFLQLHREPLLQRSVVDAELQAGTRLCTELSACLDELEHAPTPPPVPAETVLAAMARLEQMRGAVRRMGRGCDGARLLAVFGVTLPLDSSEPALVAHAIAQFLEGAGQNLERLHLFRFVTADLEELKHHRRVLLSLCPDGVGESLRGRADCLLAALEGFYASIATAIAQAFPEQDPRRRQGLAVIPRARERRHQGSQTSRPDRLNS